jgi:hypothetical protein
MFTTCGKKEWSKDYIAKKCNDDFSKRSKINEIYSAAQVILLCDCIAEKMYTNYKSEAEANKDLEGNKQIGSDCAIEIMQ